MRHKPFTLQLVVVGGFLTFMFVLFALAKSVYQDYKLELDIEAFEAAVNELEVLARQKPHDVLYYQSEEYKDKYAKENLNLINPGEKLIIIPQDEKIVKTEVVIDRFSLDKLVQLPNRTQWWEYFFGQTLSVSAPQRGGDALNPAKDADFPLDDPKVNL